jgi:hypothetical protein
VTTNPGGIFGGSATALRRSWHSASTEQRHAERQERENTDEIHTHLVLLGGTQVTPDAPLHRPVVIGTEFSTMGECQQAASTAALHSTDGMGNKGYVGAQYLCVRNK